MKIRNVIGASVATLCALMVLDGFFGRQAVYFGRYITQGASLNWNGMVFPIAKPIAIPPGYDTQFVAFRVFKSDWSGFIPDVSFELKATYDDEFLKGLERYCGDRVDPCEKGVRTIAGREFTYVAFADKFPGIWGEYHAHFLSSSPAMTMVYHGDTSDFRYFDEMLKQTKPADSLSHANSAAQHGAPGATVLALRARSAAEHRRWAAR